MLTLLEIDMAKHAHLLILAPMFSELAADDSARRFMAICRFVCISLVFVIAAISVLRIHAFLALIAAALLAGILSSRLPDETGTSDRNIAFARWN